MDLIYGLASVADVGVMQGLIHSLLALSVVITLLSLDFPDLSIEGTFPFGAAFGAVLLTHSFNPWLCLLFVALAGAMAGSITGLLHVRFQMSRLLSGISVAAMLYSASLLVMNGHASISLLTTSTLFSRFENIDRWFSSSVIGVGHYYFHPGTILAAAFVAVIVLLMMNRLLVSEVGVILRGVGINEPALRHFGRSSGVYKIVGLAIGNALASVAGALSAQYQGFADVNMGIGVLVSSLIAVVLGQEIFSRIHLKLDRPKRVTAAAFVGALTYQILSAIILTLGAPPTALRFLSGFVLILVVVIRRRHSEVSFSW